MSSPFDSTELTELTELTGPQAPADRGGQLSGGAVSIACASCRRLVAAAALCPYCGHVPAPAATAAPAARRPRRRSRRAAAQPAMHDAAPPADPTLVLPPVPDATTEFDLPWSEHRRPFQQAPFDPAPTDPAQPYGPLPLPDAFDATTFPAPVGAGGPGRRRGVAVVAGAAGLALVGVVAVAGLRSSGGGGEPTSSAGAGQAAASDVSPVSRSDVHATASSTQHPDGSVSYAAANTLDGRPETAWNSDGQGVGASLTYTFSAPVDLRSITVRNGYQKTLTRSDGSPVDLYLLNERVKAVRIVTDAGSATWTLRDDRAPQTFGHAFGTTRSVRLEVMSVYAGQKYRDLALSDVSFGAASG